MFKKNQNRTIVFAGGAALGFAHIGAIKSIEENNIQYNELIGTSFGAVVATFLSVGYNYKKITELLEEINYLKLLKINIFDLSSLIEQTKIRNFLQEKIGDITFNEVQTNLKIIATNIDNGEKIVFSKNNNIKIIDAICASISIPAIFKPYKINGNSYVDGFVTSNLPIEESENKNIIAINTISQKFIENKKHKFPNQIIEKSYYLMLLNQTKEKLKNIKNKNIKYIEFDLEEFKPYDFHKWRNLVDIGYKQFKEKYI